MGNKKWMGYHDLGYCPNDESGKERQLRIKTYRRYIDTKSQKQGKQYIPDAHRLRYLRFGVYCAEKSCSACRMHHQFKRKYGSLHNYRSNQSLAQNDQEHAKHSKYVRPFGKRRH